jgi:hypothetical protein
MEINPGSSIKLTRIPRREPGVDQLVRGYNSVFTFAEEDQQKFEETLLEKQSGRVEYQPEMNQTEEYQTPQGYNPRLDHIVNFYDSIRNGSPLKQGPEFGFRAAAPSLLTNTSLQEQRTIRWDPEGMSVV